MPRTRVATVVAGHECPAYSPFGPGPTPASARPRPRLQSSRRFFVTRRKPNSKTSHGSPLACHWSLDPEIIQLNHGSFGATPTVVLDRQTELRRRLEADPTGFFLRELPDLAETARDALASFVGADNAGPELAEELSMQSTVAPTLLVYAKDDKWYQGGVAYAQGLKDAGFSARMQVYEKGGHGLDGIDWYPLCRQWLIDEKIIGE